MATATGQATARQKATDMYRNLQKIDTFRQRVQKTAKRELVEGVAHG